MPSYSYKDIYLIPTYSTLTSRSQADTTVEFLGYKFNSPIIPANMACVIDFELAEELARNNYFYILHRFYPYNFIYGWIEKRIKDVPFGLISISVGVKEKDKELIKQLSKLFIHRLIITIDIAHGYSLNMKQMIEFIKKYIPNTKIIAGNISGNFESVTALQDWGVDALKIGIGPGAGCSTYEATGFTSPMFSAGLEAAKTAKIPLIGDGGVRTPGDITKAISCGYDMVMVGSLLAACQESPASIIDNKKVYYGSASFDSTGSYNHIEGKTIFLPIERKTYLEKYRELNEHLKSSISYAGGSKLKDLRKVEFGIFNS